MPPQRSRSGSTVTFREQAAPDRAQLAPARPTPSSDVSFDSFLGAPNRLGRRRASTVTFSDRPPPFSAGSSRSVLPSEVDAEYLQASIDRQRAASSATLFPDEPVKSLDDGKLEKSVDPLDDDLEKQPPEPPKDVDDEPYTSMPARVGRRRASSMTLVATAPARMSKYKLRRPSSLTLAPSPVPPTDLLPTFTRGDTSDPPRGPGLRARLRGVWTWQGGLDRSPTGARLHHLDSLKLIAALTLLSATVFTTSTREWAGAETFLYPVRSDFALSVFMVLVGRILPVPWLEPLASEKGGKPTATMRQFGQALLRRPFRFLPVLLICGLQYAVGKAGGPFANSEPLRQLFGGVAELPQWTLASPRSWAGVATSLFVASDMSVYLKSVASTLYVTPWLLQGSLYILGVATFSSLFKNNSRQALFIFLAIVNWTTYSFLLPPMLGLIIADLSVCGTLARVSTGGASHRGLRLAVQCGVAAALAVLFFVAPLREGLSDGLAHAQVLHGTQGDPLTSGHQLLRFSDVISAALLVLLAEVAWPVRVVLSFRPLAAFGRFGAASIAIAHPLVLFWLVPRLYQPSFDAVEDSAGSVLARVWGLTLALSIAAAPLVALVAELPSQVLGRLCVRFFLPDEAPPAEQTPPSPPPEVKDSPAVTLVTPPSPMALRKESPVPSPLRKQSFASTLYSPDSPRKDSMAPTLYKYSPRKDSFAPTLYGTDSPRKDSFAPTLYGDSPRKDSFAPTLYGTDSPRKDSFAPTLYGADSPRKDSLAPTLYGAESPRKDSFAPSLYGEDSQRKDSLAPTLCEAPAGPYRKDSFTPSLLVPPSPLRRDSLAPTLFPPPSPLRRDSLAPTLYPPPSPLRRTSVALPPVHSPSPLGPGNDSSSGSSA